MAPRGIHLYPGDVYQLPHRPATASPSTGSLQPPPQPSGTKRNRSGRPIAASTPSPGLTRHAGHVRHSCRQSISSRSASSSSSDGDSDSDSDSKSDSSDWSSGSGDEYTLPFNHDFHAVRSDLQLFAYTCACKWKATANYGAPADDRLPPRKRARTAGRRHGAARIKQDEDPMDSQLVVISHDGYFHLKCPYYVRNSAKYKRCLLQDDLQSVEAVIDHLCNHHMEPPCCAMCYRVFDKARDRDEHMSKRTCKVRDKIEIDGIDLYQKEKLSRRDRVYHGEKKRWYRIWRTVFPNTTLPHSPYLDRGVGLEVSMVRDYWAANGRDCVSQYLTRRGLLRHHRQDEERALAALAELALQDMLIRVMKEHNA